MPRTFTLAQLRTLVRQRADRENDPHVTDTEINSYISASYGELYDLLVQSGLPYFKATQTIVTTGSSNPYALSSDFYAMIRVWYKAGTDTWWPLREAHPREVHRFLALTGTRRAVAYEVTGTTPAGDSLELFPIPPAGQTYEVRYFPRPLDLTTDADVVDGVSGWEEFIVVDAALKCLTKSTPEEAAPLWQAKNQQLERIKRMAQNRQIANAHSLFIEEDYTEADPASWRGY